MDNKSTDELISGLEKTIEIYEQVVSLAREELLHAYKIISSYEAVNDLSRVELLAIKKEIENIRHTSEIKTSFFSNISHEIRTPLTLMLTPLESMLMGEVGSFTDEQMAYLKLVHENSERLLKMVNELLDFSKLEAGKMKLFYQEQDFCCMVRNILQTFIPYAANAGIDFNVEVPDYEIPIYMDIEKIEKVITNVVFNAFKYVEPDGKITVSIRDDVNKLTFAVFNSGECLPEDFLASIFDRYSRFRFLANVSMPGGTGLGLALAKEFIELHHGAIRIENFAEQGVVCSFSLLKGDEHISDDLLMPGWGALERRKIKNVTDERILSNRGISSLYSEVKNFYSLNESDLSRFMASINTDKVDSYLGKSRNKRALIVEDNAEMLGFLRYVLSSSFEVYGATNGEEGYTLALEVLPDIILSDVMMPKLDGIALTKLLKSDSRTRRIPIILITAKANNINSMIDSFNVGADDYISKPFNVKELLARCNALLRMASLNDKLVSTEGVVYSLANAVEAKDAYTEGHSFRLAWLCSEISRKMGLPSEDVELIKNGAILHDIGKIGVPEMILTKSSPLTNDEMEIIRQHPIIGEKICRPLKATSNILPIILHHHERYDGGGYPHQLKGEAIPLGARIVAIADAFDAMAYDRVYKQGRGISGARKIIKDERLSGQWDAAIIDYFLEISEEDLRMNMEKADVNRLN